MKSVMKIKLDDGAKMPKKAHATDVGYDIFSPIDVVVPAHRSVFIDSGVHIQIPLDIAGVLISKSGLNVKHGITSTALIKQKEAMVALAQQVNNCCYNCSERHLRCHSNCEKYKAFKEDVRKRNNYIWEHIESQNALASSIISRNLRKNKNRR